MDDAEAGIENLVETLALERIEENLYRGQPSPRDTKRIFGGHVIAQALLAAYATVEPERICHSLHCYFIRPGDPSIPILYEVDRARDGTSFTTRRVKAIQHGRQIFNMACSFQVDEPGFEHQAAAPPAPPPETLPDAFTFYAALLNSAERGSPAGSRPIEQRAVHPRKPGEVALPISYSWMRAKAAIGPDLRWHQAILAYATDMGLLEVGMRPHGLSFGAPGFQPASLDHAIWFHRPFDFNQWHLFDQESPSASGARALNRGQIFSQDGVLVASTAQEGLIRQR